MGASHRSPQTTESPKPPTSIEICAGAGGQAVGLHNAGFKHLALVELDPHAIETLRKNVAIHWSEWDGEKAAQLRPMDVKDFLKSEVLKNLNLKRKELDLLAGGVPCPPFSLAGRQLGEDDERDLFPEMINMVDRLRPKAIMIENVRGILEPPRVFIDYRRRILEDLRELGYAIPEINKNWDPETQDAAMRGVWRRLDARDFGVPQLRPRATLVAIRNDILEDARFVWPLRRKGETASVFDQLIDSMEERCRAFWDKNKDGKTAKRGEATGEEVFEKWKVKAEKAKASPTEGVAPTLVGGSKKHGGADLGPTRAKRAWETLGVDATGVANDLEECLASRDLFRKAGPMLTVNQAAALQGFPATWDFQGGKTARYRQVGNAFPPPVAEAVGRAIYSVLRPNESMTALKGYELEDPDSSAANQPTQQMAF